MRYAIVYSSKTGNTQKLAEALHLWLKGKDHALCETKYADHIDADFYFVGFWTCRGECDEDTKAFLAGLENKEVFLFGTAGFGGSRIYDQRVLKKTRQYLHTSVKSEGGFMCQGKMAVRTGDTREKKLRTVLARMFAKRMPKDDDRTQDHPNQQDLNSLCTMLRKTLPDLALCQECAEKLGEPK